MHIEFGTGRTTALQNLANPAVIGVVTALLGPVGGVTAATGAKLDGSLRTAIAKAAGSATGAAVSDERLRDRLATTEYAITWGGLQVAPAVVVAVAVVGLRLRGLRSRPAGRKIQLHCAR